MWPMNRDLRICRHHASCPCLPMRGVISPVNRALRGCCVPRTKPAQRPSTAAANAQTTEHTYSYSTQTSVVLGCDLSAQSCGWAVVLLVRHHGPVQPKDRKIERSKDRRIEGSKDRKHHAKNMSSSINDATTILTCTDIYRSLHHFNFRKRNQENKKLHQISPAYFYT